MDTVWCLIYKGKSIGNIKYDSRNRSIVIYKWIKDSSTLFPKIKISELLKGSPEGLTWWTDVSFAWNSSSNAWYETSTLVPFKVCGALLTTLFATAKQRRKNKEALNTLTQWTKNTSSKNQTIFICVKLSCRNWIRFMKEMNGSLNVFMEMNGQWLEQGWVCVE